MKPLQITAIYTYDLTMFGDQLRLQDVPDMECLQIYMVGFLVDECEEFLCLSQQVFNEDIPNVRFTVKVPKACIIDRKDILLHPKEGADDLKDKLAQLFPDQEESDDS